MMTTPRRLAQGLLAVAACAGLLALPSPASSVPPGPCDTPSDYGTFDSTHNSSYIGGTWYNCSSSATDWVFIEVRNASDSPCTPVAPGSRHISYDPFYWAPGLDHTRTWRRC